MVRDGHEPKRGRLKRWLITLSVVLAIVGVGLFVFHYLSQNALDEAIAEADRLDPGWRWEELQAKRSSLPDEENAALQVLKVLDLLPRGWRTLIDSVRKSVAGQEEGALGEIAPNTRLTPKHAQALRADLGGVREALHEARKLAHLHQGHFPDVDPQSALGGSLKQVQGFREVGNLLRYDGLLRAEEGDLASALIAFRSGMNAGHALSSEPALITQLVHLSNAAIAIANLERILALGEATDVSLAGAQQDLEAHLATNCLLEGMRGERAAWFEACHNLVAMSGGTSFSSIPFLEGWATGNKAQLLHSMTQAVETAKLPAEQQRQVFLATEQELLKARAGRLSRIKNLYVVLAMPATLQLSEAFLRDRALAGSALLAIAAERFRIQNGRWPNTVDELQPLIKQLPIDPYSGKPFRLKRLPDGLVFYSVGPDGVDDDGKLVRPPTARTGEDIGFQLWNVEFRRLPPKPENGTEK